MSPFVTYWFTTILLVVMCVILGGLVGYTVGLKEGVNMFLIDDEEDEILDAEEVN